MKINSLKKNFFNVLNKFQANRVRICVTMNLAIFNILFSSSTEHILILILNYFALKYLNTVEPRLSA